MKSLAIIIVSLFPLLSIAQSKPKTTKSTKHTTFTKKVTSDNLKYVIEDSVTVENGKGEKKKIYTILAVNKAVWDKAAPGWGDRDYLEYITQEIADNAKKQATNELSFEPLNNNQISYDDPSGLYKCNYRMMARNGFGKMVETTVLAICKPRPW